MLTWHPVSSLQRQEGDFPFVSLLALHLQYPVLTCTLAPSCSCVSVQCQALNKAGTLRMVEGPLCLYLLCRIKETQFQILTYASCSKELLWKYLDHVLASAVSIFLWNHSLACYCCCLYKFYCTYQHVVCSFVSKPVSSTQHWYFWDVSCSAYTSNTHKKNDIR